MSISELANLKSEKTEERNINNYKVIINNNPNIEDIVSRLVDSRDSEILDKLDLMTQNPVSTSENSGLLKGTWKKLEDFKDNYELVTFIINLVGTIGTSWAAVKLIIYPFLPPEIKSIVDSLGI